MPTRLSIYRRLLGYLSPYRAQMTVAYVAMFFASLLNLAVPQIIKDAIDRGLATQSAVVLLWAAALILGLAVLRALAGMTQRFYGQWLTHRVSYDLRSAFYNAVQNQTFAFHDKAHTGDLMSRATSDTSETEQFVGIGLMDLLATVLLVVGVVVAMLLENVQLTLLALPFIAGFIIVSLRLGLEVEPKFKKVQAQMGKLSTMMQESLTGISVVKAFAREPHEFAKFDRENAMWLTMRRSVIRTWGNYWPTFSFVLMLGVFAQLWIGGPWARDGEITVGSLFAMISYMLMLNAPVQRLGFLVNLAATASASAGRLFAIIDRPIEVVERPDAIELGRVEGRVEFEHVSFAYRGEGESGTPINTDEHGLNARKNGGNRTQFDTDFHRLKAGERATRMSAVERGLHVEKEGGNGTQIGTDLHRAEAEKSRVQIHAVERGLNVRGSASSGLSASFTGDRPALVDLCFTIEPGQTVALIGPTGSGKSTVINLLPRFYDPTGGTIRVDGIDVRQVQLRSLRRQIGIVLQNPFLFSATIGENIAYGRPEATLTEIENVAKAADAHDFVMGFPAGYQTKVGERGVTLSGGQKQRIAIARALLTDPRILILDDSTSSVDTETEYQIQQALAVLMQGRTTLVIAQRLLTLKRADCILVLDHGAIVERGTHSELLKQGGLYKQIYDLQLKDQEEFVESEKRGDYSV